MIKQKGIIVLILLVIVLLVAYVFYTRYGSKSVIENFNDSSRLVDDMDYLYTPYPDIKLFNKQDYQGGRMYKHDDHVGGFLKGIFDLSNTNYKIAIEKEVVENENLLLYPLDFDAKEGNNHKFRAIKFHVQHSTSGAQESYVSKYLNRKSFTISFWAKFKRVNSYQVIFFCSHSSALAHSQSLVIGISRDGELAFDFWDNNQRTDKNVEQFNTGVYTEKYHHYTFTYDYENNVRKTELKTS